MSIKKLCRYCNKYYSESEFGVALTTEKKVYRRHKCRYCYRDTKNKLREKYRQWLIDYKKEQKCIKCKISDHRVLEFHHLGDKENDIATLFHRSSGLDRIKREIKKCVVVCANCHKIMHYNERGLNKK